MSLTDEQRANLDKLATYLEGLPPDYDHFGMRDWLTGADKSAEVRYALHNGGVASCGTAACAVGHGPAAGILVPPELVSEGGVLRGVNWWAYGRLFTNGSPGVFEWLFEADWRKADDSHYGAAARIRYLLDNGKPPPDFEYADRAHRFVPLYAHYRIDAKATS